METKTAKKNFFKTKQNNSMVIKELKFENLLLHLP